MRTTLTIKIKKRSQPGWLMWLIIVLPFMFGVLNQFLGLPGMIRYLLDVAWVLLIVYMLRFFHSINWKAVKGLVGWVCVFLLYTCAVYLVQYQSALYYLWGARNDFRFYPTFLAFAVFLTPRDIDDYLKLFDKLFWVNVVVSLVQFFLLGYNGDYLGGIFGTEKGANAYTNIFFSIVVTKSLLFYLEKKESFWSCILKCMAALIVAALAEIKFFFVVFLVIIVLAVLLTNFTWRKLLMIVSGFSVVGLGAILLATIFPDSTGFLSVDFLWNRATASSGYTVSGDLNRLNAISRIDELWLTNWGQRLFGLGLGNCELSTISAVNTPFYKANGDMHYTWLSYAMMYLECGWIGLLFYFGFFVLVYLSICRIENRSEGIARTYCRISRIIAVCCILVSVYNSSLRTEAGYMVYFVLAIPFVFERNRTAAVRRKQA